MKLARECSFGAVGPPKRKCNVQPGARPAAAERFAAGELVAFEARLAAVHRTTPRSDDPSRRHLPLDPSFADATAASSLRPAFALTALELPRFD